MKKTLFVSVFLFCLGFIAGALRAEDTTVSGINIKDILHNTRAGVWLPFEGGKTFKTVYSPLIWLHSTTGVEYISLDVGAAAPGDLTKGYAFAGIGFRLDNLLDRALGLTPWIQKHIGSATLPSMEAGAGPMLYNSRIRFGATVAIKF